MIIEFSLAGILLVVGLGILMGVIVGFTLLFLLICVMRSRYLISFLQAVGPSVGRSVGPSVGRSVQVFSPATHSTGHFQFSLRRREMKTNEMSSVIVSCRVFESLSVSLGACLALLRRRSINCYLSCSAEFCLLAHKKAQRKVENRSKTQR